MLTACLTVDVEPDCPPYLTSTFRGIETGMPALLDLLSAERVPATCFTTGDVASKYPDVVARVVGDEHELACHGYSHTAFDTMDRSTAADEIHRSTEVLRAFDTVRSFRAPYLRFPDAYLDLLEDAGYVLDSSHAKYKLAYYRSSAATTLRRIPASVTSSVLRLPSVVRETYLRALRSPIVLFVHPWEFVDLRRERLRLDCRFRTGEQALECLASAIAFLRRRGASFVRMDRLAA